jgi:DNA-binding CsgD family transcriptional regulator
MLELSELAWNNASFAAVVVDSSSRVIFLNRMAEELIGEGRGLAVKLGVLTTTDSPTNAMLAEHITRVTRAEGRSHSIAGNAMRIPRETRSPLMVLVMPLLRPGAKLVSDGPAAMLLITDPDYRRRPIGRHLIEWFELSQAEATLAVQLVDGTRLEVLAEQRRVRMSTLRSQLSAILSKTGTTRQTELISLLNQLPTAYQAHPIGGGPKGRVVTA